MKDVEINELLVVIVNWCKPVDTIECVHSLLNANIPPHRLLVIDNGSTDNSFEQIKNAYPMIEIHKLEKNVGFTGGYNYGIKLALNTNASRIFLLNNDTIVSADAIPYLMSSDWDVCVPKIYFYRNPKEIWAAGCHWRFFPPMVIMRGYQKPDHPRYDKPMSLDYTTACAILVRREVFERVGGFDTEFENYQEDYDFSYRVRKAGFTIGYVPRAKIWHKGSTSLGKSSPRLWWYLGRNSVLFYRKSRRFPLWMLLSFLGWVSIREIIMSNFHRLPDFWRGVRAGNEWIKDGNRRL